MMINVAYLSVFNIIPQTILSMWKTWGKLHIAYSPNNVFMYIQLASNYSNLYTTVDSESESDSPSFSSKIIVSSFL